MPGNLHTSDLLSVIDNIETYKANLRTAIQNRNIDLPSSVKLDKYPDYIKLIKDDISIDYIENSNTSQYISTGVCPHRIVAKFKYGFLPAKIDRFESSGTSYYTYGPQSLGTQMIMGSCTHTLPTTSSIYYVPGNSILDYCNYFNIYGIWNGAPYTNLIRNYLIFGGVNPVTGYETYTYRMHNTVTNYVVGPEITSTNYIYTYTIDATRNVSMTVNGTTYNITSREPYSLSSTNNVSWNIFKDGLGTGCRIYYADFYDSSNTLVRSLRPRLHYHNGVMEPCLYDLVSGNYFYNQGSGTFNYPSYSI